MTPPRVGFTLVELLVAMTLFGMLSTILSSVLRTTARVQRQLTVDAEQSDALRSALHLLRGDLLELSATDTTGGDILTMNRGSLEYRVMKGLGFLCEPPDTGANRIAIYDDNSLRFPVGGLPINPSRDELIVFAAGSASRPDDDRWVRREVTATSRANSCPGGAPSRTFTLAGAPIPDVHAGAPVRVVQRFRIRAYADSYGDWWIGMEQAARAGGWNRIQPVVGPIIPSGLQFVYLDRSGHETADRHRVDRVRVTVFAGGGRGRRVRMLSTDVALRNNDPQ